MRWLEWFSLAILGAAVSVAPEATRAAESGNMFSLAKSRDPDQSNTPDGNVIARHSGAESGGLAPDLFMLSKGKVDDRSATGKLGGTAANPVQAQGYVVGQVETLKAAPRLTPVVEMLDGSRAISPAIAKLDGARLIAGPPSVQFASAEAPAPEIGPVLVVKDSLSPTTVRPAEFPQISPRPAPNETITRSARIDGRLATQLVPPIHPTATASAGDAELDMTRFMGPSFRATANLKDSFQVTASYKTEALLKAVALDGVVQKAVEPQRVQLVADAGQPEAAPRVAAPIAPPISAPPIATARAGASIVLEPLLVAQPVFAADVPERGFQSASALRSTLQLAGPEAVFATKGDVPPGRGELTLPPAVEMATATGADVAPVMLMAMISPPPPPVEPVAETDLRSSGPRSSANVSAPDPLWLRKENATAKPLTVATAPEKPAPSRAEAAMIDSLVSWAERQNSPDTSDKDAASGGEVVVFELGAPSRRPESRPADPVMTALPKSPRDLREQLARPAPAGLGSVELAAAETKPRLPDPSLLELVSLADKSYVKPELGMAILPLAPLDAAAPDDARDTIDTITLGDLVSRANYHSEDVRADREGERSSRLAANSTLSQLGPRFDARYSKGHEHSFTSVGATPIDKPGHVRADGSTVIVQPLFDAVSIAGMARDQQLARGAQSRRRSTQVNVSFEAVTNYFDMLAARLALDLALKHQTQMNKLLDYMAKRAQLGGASEADFERVRAVTLSAKRAVIDARGELDAALSAMQRISGVTAVQIAVPDKLYLDIPEDSDSAFAQMVRRNPELKSAFLQIKAAHEDAVAAAARAAPKVNLEMGRYQSQNASGAHGTTVDSRLMIVGSVSLGAGTEAFQAMSQSAHVSELKHRYASALRAAKERLRTIYLSRQNISDQRAVAWQEFASNTKVADAFDEQLFSANRSLIDVLDTYQKFYQSKLNIVRISVNQMKIGYQIKQIIGDLSQDNAGDEVTDVASAGSK